MCDEKSFDLFQLNILKLTLNNRDNRTIITRKPFKNNINV